MSFETPFGEDRALESLTAAAGGGDADHVEVTLLARSGEYTRFAGDRIHQPQDITEVQVMVRAIVDGHVGRAATSRLDRAAETVTTATAIARELRRTSGSTRPTSASQSPAGQPTANAQSAQWREGPGSSGRMPVGRVGQDGTGLPLLWHDDTAGFDAGVRVALAAEAMRQAGAAGGWANGMFGRAVTQIAVATSAGIVRHAIATEASGSLTVAVDDGTSHWIDLHRSSDALRSAESVEATVRRALAGRGRVEVAAGGYTVVLGPEAVGELLGFLEAFGFSGELAASGVGLCANRSGERIASPLVNVADNALHGDGLPIPFDIEGTPKRIVPFLNEGVVGDPVTDLATAAALGRPSTGHAHIAREEVPTPVAANIVMSPGSAREEDLIAGVERGLYVERFWYTRLVDRQTGTITGVSRDGCFQITDGTLGRPVAGARFTQSIPDFLATVDGVGDSTRSQPVMNVWNGAVTAPAVRGHGFRFGPRPVPVSEGS